MAATIRLASDATEADIIKALADLTSGGTLILPENRTIAIRSGIDIDMSGRDITIDLNGSTLRKAGDVSVITGRGQHDDPVSVKLGMDGGGNTVAFYSKPPEGLSPGDWVKIVADDRLPGDHLDGLLPSRMGQAMEVASVAGNAVTFKGALIDQAHYDSNIRASAYEGGELVIKNGHITGEQDRFWWNMPLVQLRSLVGASVENVTVRDNIGRGISVVDSIDAELTNIIAKNLIDGGSAALGIAVSSLSSIGTTVRGLYAQDVTHAADSNAMGIPWNAPNIARYGADIGMAVSDSVAVGARDFAWSWHSESLRGSFDNVLAFDSYGFLMGRGIGGRMTDSGGAGNERGVIFYEYGDNDGRDITLDGIVLRETQQYSVFSANSPFNNFILNSLLEAFGPGNLAEARHVDARGAVFAKAGDNPDDVLTGSSESDMLLGGKGADVISAGGGNDYIWGGAGRDHLTGGFGRDRFAFNAGSEGGDIIADFQGGAGGDVLDLSVLAAKYGWQGQDPFARGNLRFVQDGADVLLQLDPNGGGDRFSTLARLENIQVSQIGAANLQLTLTGEAAAPPPPPPDPDPDPDPGHLLRGTEADDLLRGEPGITHIIGGGGNDKLHASIGDTLLEGGAGDDGISGNRGNDVLKGGAGQDRLSAGEGLDKLYGETGDDSLLGGDGQDRLYGGDSDDILDGGADADLLSGGKGYDTASYASASIGVLADIASPASNSGGAAGDSFSAIENLSGSAYDDVLRGNKAGNVLDGQDGDDRLFGRLGADILRGGDGADWLDGGAWKDVLTGGSGADSFYFGAIAQAGDTITDFQSGVDHVVLSGDGFGIGGGGFSYVEGPEAVSGRPTILFDEGGGRLLWDDDGIGADKAVLLVNFSTTVHFSQADILIG
jgi:Ca2+-binding RTX toxin-like protein